MFKQISGIANENLEGFGKSNERINFSKPENLQNLQISIMKLYMIIEMSRQRFSQEFSK